MDVKLKDGQAGVKDVYIKNGDNVLCMSYMRNMDLYWLMYKSDPDSLKETIEIPKTEKDIYGLFDELYQDVSHCKVFEAKDKKDIPRVRKLNKNYEYKLKERNLFNPETKTIEWHSDETYFDSDDIVKIIKEEDKYKVEFTCPEKYEDPYKWSSPIMISVRFRNSGSYYDPFNIVFMRIFNKALNLKERGFEELNKKNKTENER